MSSLRTGNNRRRAKLRGERIRAWFDDFGPRGVTTVGGMTTMSFGSSRRLPPLRVQPLTRDHVRRNLGAAV